MTTELTKAAQQALEACPFCGGKNIKVHSYSDAVIGGEPDAFAQCHDCSVTGPNGKTEADAAESWNTRALTQRPAAQEVAAYFSYGEDAGYLEHATAEAAREQAKADIRGYRNDAMHDNEWPSEVDSVCWGVVLQKATAVDNSEESGQESFEYELGPATQQATPEPVGEVVYIAKGHLREVLNGNTMNAYLSPEPDRFADVALFTRPAPGVPGDSELLDYLDTLATRAAGSDLHCFGGRVALYVRTGIGSQIEASGAGTAREAIRAALAAARAKGADK